MMQRATVLFAVIGLWVMGCATSKGVKEVAAFQGDFAKYNSAVIVMEKNTQIESKYSQESLGQILHKQLTERRIFTRVTSGTDTGGDLVIKVKVKEVDAPGALTSIFASTAANSEVKVDCVFVEGKAKRSLASLETTGNSKNMPRSKVGGIGVTSGSAYTTRAYENAAEAIVDYVLAHHSVKKTEMKN